MRPQRLWLMFLRTTGALREAVNPAKKSGSDHLKRETLKEKMESFWPKKLSHKFDTRFRVSVRYLSQIDSKLRVNKSNWLSISSQFDSNILQLLGIPGRILVPPVTQLFRLNWLHFSFQWSVRKRWEQQRNTVAANCEPQMPRVLTYQEISAQISPKTNMGLHLVLTDELVDVYRADALMNAIVLWRI